MKNKVFRELQLFAAETGTTVAADLTPAISVDFTSRIAQNIVELQQLLGITDLIPICLLYTYPSPRDRWRTGCSGRRR